MRTVAPARAAIDRPEGSWFSTRRLLWGVPLFMTIQNAEKAWMFYRLAAPLDPVTILQLLSGILLISAAAVGLTYLVGKRPQDAIGVYMLLGVQFVMLLSAGVLIAQFCASRQYEPGAATSLLLTVPFSVLLFARALRTHVVQPSKLMIVFVVAWLIYLSTSHLTIGGDAQASRHESHSALCARPVRTSLVGRRAADV